MNILQLWPAILFGWPAILAAFALSVAGVVRRRYKWLVIATILAVPFSFYLAGTPRFGWLGLTIPVLLGGASIAVYQHHTRIAWFLLALFLGGTGWLAIVVMNQ